MDVQNTAMTDRRRQTRKKIYNYIYNAGEPCSKLDIFNDLSLSFPTVYQNLDELLEEGLIEYCGQQQSKGGRPAMLIRIVKDARTAVGMYIASEYVRFVSTNLLREDTGYKEIPIIFEPDSSDYWQRVRDELDTFIDESHIDRNTLLGIGIAVPGLVVSQERSDIYAPSLDKRFFSLKEFTGSLSYPYYIENDASSGGFAEWYGSKSSRSIAYLSLEDGVGGAVLVNGSPFPGNNNRSGEFGHITIERNGKLCSCGRRGCLEAYCSAKRLGSDLGITPGEFFKELENGNAEYKAIWDDYREHLAIGIHNIRMSLDCEVVLGGFLAEHLNSRLDEIREELKKSDPFDDNCEYLSVSTEAKYSSLIGVAYNFIRTFLESI